MPDRKSLVFTLWLVSSLALMASVTVTPIRTSGFVDAGSSGSDRVCRDFDLPPSQPTPYLRTAIATDAVLQLNALPSENDEEQDRVDALDAPRFSFLIPCSFRKVANHQSIAPLSILSHYPLRC